MKYLSSIVIIVGFLLPNVSASQTLRGDEESVLSADPAIAEKLRAIVTIRQRLAEYNEQALRSGRGEPDGRYEIALAEARVELARELGQRNEQVAALQEILKVKQLRLEEAKKGVEVGAVTPADVERVMVAVLEAEVRLLRTQNSAKKP